MPVNPCPMSSNPCVCVRQPWEERQGSLGRLLNRALLRVRTRSRGRIKLIAVCCIGSPCCLRQWLLLSSVGLTYHCGTFWLGFGTWWTTRCFGLAIENVLKVRQNPAPSQNRDSIGNPVRRVCLVPPWCLPGCSNGSCLPPWCLPGVHFILSCLPGAS